MITAHEQQRRAAGSGSRPAGLPPGTVVERIPLADGGILELAVVAVSGRSTRRRTTRDRGTGRQQRHWVAAITPGGEPPLIVPLYGTAVVLEPARAAAIGPADRLAAMRAALRRVRRP